ncbi:hypothetical protein BD414DRAFT_208588 [Trametes punicea]|nr:hypothetical protein BD414DRAFT_208588 [Trametes punicea]
MNTYSHMCRTSGTWLESRVAQGCPYRTSESSFKRPSSPRIASTQQRQQTTKHVPTPHMGPTEENRMGGGG